ncbi:hypothetical protein [Fusobacterium sp.]|uniref:hypothetical protein n=1 Tax=Fusobacterium sp. TaxID=68766 RepID=UPI00396C9A75
MNNERIDTILKAFDTFNNTGRKRLVAGKLYDYFMQDFKGELTALYQDATKEEIREDVKTLADMIYLANKKAKREFLVGVLRHIVKMM